MDAGDSITGVEVSHQIGVPQSSQGGVIMDKANVVFDSTTENEGLSQSTEVVGQAGNSGTPHYSAENDEEGSTFHEDVGGSAISKESRVEERDNTNHSKKGQGKLTTGKLSNPKNVATLVKKNKDGKIGSVTSKKPFAIATNRRLSNDRQVSESVDSTRPTKLASAPSPDQISQHTGKSCTASPATSTTASEGLRKHAKHLKPLKQGPHAKVEENMHSASLSPTEGDTKPRRTGGLPSYGFSFKCDERAQKRKEFNAKLEEKIHAKEVEKTTMQAKSQETQEAEMKMLRKSLMFKATPMPSFYHEPAPPKVELKKVPPTRPKSPKFGRHKSSPSVDSEGSSKNGSESGRLSLDEKVAQIHLTKGSSYQHVRKPLRKSLPRLPSEKTTLANATQDATTSTAQRPEHLKTDLEAAKTSEKCQTQSDVDAELLAEEQELTSSEEAESEHIASEQSIKQH